MLLITIIIFFLHKSPLASSSSSPSSPCLSETAALLAFKKSLSSSSSRNPLQSWRIGNTNMSSWQGLTLNRQGQVLQLQLSALDFHGSLYPIWGFLPSVRSIDLSNNSFVGTFPIPPSSSSCSSSATTLVFLDLSSNHLSGPLPDQLRLLQSLQELHLHHNDLSGELPHGLFELTSLQRLDLSWNNFTGSGSSSLAAFQSLRSLELLNLSQNNFSGTFPSFSKQLRSLDLSGNRFTGHLPSYALQQIQVLNLSRNLFTGPLPAAASDASMIRVLDLESNTFTGDLSSSFAKMALNLEHLNLASNNLSGEIPSLLLLTKLRVLDLCSNAFKGDIPETIVNLRSLEQLKLSNNQLSRFPDLGTALPTSLKVLSAGNNRFSGPMLVSRSPSLSSSKLEVLYLSDNLFTGRIPDELGELKSLKRLVLNRNDFRGSIPASLANSELLEEIWINNNRLTGHIPVEIFTLKFLRMLVLANNSLSGSPVPRGISKCKTLEVLWLEQNNFSGSISSEIGQLHSLLMLSLASNSLTGRIPASIGKLSNLVGLDLGSNALSGPIPNELAGLTSIQFLFLSDNRMEKQIPDWVGNLSKLRALDFSFNKFSGIIPSNWKNSTLTSLSPKYSDKPPSAMVYNNEGQRYIGYALPTTVDFSHNQLVGDIPDQLGILRNLQILNLSQNKLQGSIPSSLGDVPALLKLDLSSNNLTGRIPSVLTKLTFLSDLNLSYNNLQGEIPSSGQFPTFSSFSFTGNADLCGAPLPKCYRAPKLEAAHSNDGNISRLSVAQKLIPLYIVVAGTFGFCLFWAFFIVFIRRRHKLLSQEELEDERTRKKNSSTEVSTISEGITWICSKELLAATSNYSQANIIGDGGFGIVYKAILADGSVVAVKKLITDGAFGRQGEREFLAEMQTLGKIKHRNLVCLKGYSCDGKDRILVYKFLKNGSLDTWLHCRDEGVKPLDWKTRFGIILGAARGVEFLHHDCFPPIVHRDVKASNILLDENFEAHMADFGLARLMRDAGDTHVSTDVAGTVGYIPPEYNSSCMATMRGDVYSFGVVVLETIMGKRPTDAAFRRSGGIGHLVAESVSVQELQSVVDPALVSENSSAGEAASVVSMEIVEVMRIACLCCLEKPGKRPETRHVVRMLEGVERRYSSATAAAASACASLVSPPSADGGSKHFLNNVEI